MTEQHDKHPKRCRVCGAEISHLNPGLCKNFHYQNIPEKDDVHWITGQELREIYADKLSLDKYDEIRKRPAAKVENVPLCGFFGQIDCCQTPDVRGACTVSEQCVKYYRDTSGKGAETMTSPCNFCRHRQPSLDPEGCFVQAGSTGIIGRFLRWVFGCERFDQK